MGLWTQFFPPRSKFSVDDIPDLSGQVAIVTGGNSGVGWETVKALLAHNAEVYVAARSKSRATEAIDTLEAATGKRAQFLQLDLADLASVKASAEDFLRRETRLDMLFNNGGVMVPPLDQLTVQGYDLQFGTNVLGHFYFTQLLIPIMISTAKETKKTGRILNTSSVAAHQFGQRNISYGTVVPGPERTKLGSVMKLYMQSKFGNILLSNELQRRYGGEGIMSVSMHPGNLKTELGRHAGHIIKIMQAIITYPQPLGALTQLWAGTTDEGANLGGKFLYPWARVGEMPAIAPGAEEQLWSWCEDQVKQFNNSQS
ncbi:NAD-binding protein [Mycena chlorophos]|uniref:NAD-binding protein n=1 Tax=Mycena chlorophos TaxID=658473 RepID=A0A8H6VQG7_MYCCL|nr:NAD-binding protein [Mycena chlorophos]